VTGAAAATRKRELLGPRLRPGGPQTRITGVRAACSLLAMVQIACADQVGGGD
jgi:hypothetical protein